MRRSDASCATRAKAETEEIEAMKIQRSISIREERVVSLFVSGMGAACADEVGEDAVGSRHSFG